MTREERLKHIASGKRVLKARRSPKLNAWEITYYNRASYETWNWHRFKTKELCEDEINRMVAQFPNKFIAELTPGVEAIKS
jgi:hypothetical protein